MLTFNHSPLYHFVQKINEICSLTLCTNGGMISISMKTFSQNNFTAKCPFSKITSQIQLSTTFLLIHERNPIILFFRSSRHRQGSHYTFGGSVIPPTFYGSTQTFILL